MTAINLDDNAMKDLIAKSIIDALTPERRDALIADAIKMLLASKTGDRYDARSQLQQAFDYAVRQVAERVALEELAKDDGLKTKMRELMMAGWERMVAGENQEKLVNKIAESLTRAIGGRDY